MRKILVVLTIAFVFCFTVSAFAAEPIKIGYLATLTGDGASYGVAEVQSAQMFVTEQNKKGGVLGRQLELVPYDAKSRPEDAVNAVRRMCDNDKVVAIVGANTSGINIATAAIVERAKVPQIGTATTNPLVTVDQNGKVRPYSFRLTFDDPYQGTLGAEFAYNDLGAKKAAILYNIGSDYAHGLREFFIENFERLGGKIVADESFRPDDVDFRAQLTKIRNAGADVIFLPGMGKDMALTIKQARELGMNTQFLGGDGYGEFMAEIAGKSLEGAFFILASGYLEKPSLQPIFQMYRDTYKDEPKEFGNISLAYDAMTWLCNAIERAGSTDGTAIAKALETTTDLQLAISPLTVNPENHNPYKKTGFILRVNEELTAKFYKEVTPK
ncbi:ABC transporter substrate-binding protein [Synergistaceae bacterium OttesenSCG-928-D05]|nr:ABC transporter substrate-binding protein [Synergistaceae bacterium OttesenSCG-928-D05]